jgi:hypothetical protein
MAPARHRFRSRRTDFYDCAGQYSGRRFQNGKRAARFRPREPGAACHGRAASNGVAAAAAAAALSDPQRATPGRPKGAAAPGQRPTESRWTLRSAAALSRSVRASALRPRIHPAPHYAQSVERKDCAPATNFENTLNLVRFCKDGRVSKECFLPISLDWNQSDLSGSRGSCSRTCAPARLLSLAGTQGRLKLHCSSLGRRLLRSNSFG